MHYVATINVVIGEKKEKGTFLKQHFFFLFERQQFWWKSVRMTSYHIVFNPNFNFLINYSFASQSFIFQLPKSPPWFIFGNLKWKGKKTLPEKDVKRGLFFPHPLFLRHHAWILIILVLTFVLPQQVLENKE